jgi:flavorubredoxin
MQYDLICVGAPTEAFTASKPVKEFLTKLKGINLSGKCGFAFDTKLDSHFFGSAAKFIEKELSNKGLQIIAPRESALVFSLKERGAIASARLKEGEEKRFEQIGTQVGTALAARGR